MKIERKDASIIVAAIAFVAVIVIGFASIPLSVDNDERLLPGIAVIAIASAVSIMSYILIWGMLKLLKKSKQ